MNKRMLLEISEEEVNSLSAILLDCFDHYSILSDNKDKLKSLGVVNRLNERIKKKLISDDVPAYRILELNEVGNYSFNEFKISGDVLSNFLKTMRPQGYFGMSPQNQEDLEEQHEMIEKLRVIREFVVRNYEKNKDIINQS